MSDMLFRSEGDEVVCDHFFADGALERTRPITRRNGYDLRDAADRRDLARQILSEVCGWRLANRLESAFVREVIAKLDPERWELFASDVEAWLGTALRRSA